MEGLEQVKQTWKRKRWTVCLSLAAVAAILLFLYVCLSLSTNPVLVHDSALNRTTVTPTIVTSDRPHATSRKSASPTTAPTAPVTSQLSDTKSRELELHLKMLQDLEELNRLMSQEATASPDAEMVSDETWTSVTETDQTSISSGIETEIPVIDGSEPVLETSSTAKPNKWYQILEELLGQESDPGTG